MQSMSMQAETDNDYFQSLWSGWLPEFEQRFETYLDDALENNIEAHGLVRLCEAMGHSSLSGGKRLRALLIHLVYQCCNQKDKANHGFLTSTEERMVDRASYAIELIHAYSLIHDDLPALDDDDMRRGKPTCHIQYDEATAILAGDALHSLAFECLSEPNISDLEPQLALQLIQHLSKASGALGMVGGQAIDIASENQRIDINQLTTLHRLKTGKLIYAAVMMGALCAGADNNALEALKRYGVNIGLAFQVRDDIIDITSSSEKLGKPQGADQQADKSTFPLLLGVDGASQKAMDYYQNAIEAISIFGDEARALRGLAGFFVLRDR